MRHRLSSRAANDLVNASGMCWVMRMPGQSGGMLEQELLDRLGAAGGGADDDQLFGREAAVGAAPAAAAAAAA